MEANDLATDKKKAEKQDSTIVWVDESSFYLLPMRVKTYAPCGQTPELRVPLTHDHLSAISAISQDQRLFFQVRDHSFKSADVLKFLRLLLQKIRGHIIVIWDGAPIHRSKEIQTWLARGSAHRLHLERLPAYAPDMNPDEGIWQYLKCVALRNCCFPDLRQLQSALLRAKERLRSRSLVLSGCLKQCGFLL